MTQTAERTTETLLPDSMSANPWQPRQKIAAEDVRELADSIEQIGLLQRPVVRKTGKGKTAGYQIAVGHIRVAAIRLLLELGKWPEGGVPVEVRDLTDQEMAIAALEENRKRTGLLPLDEVRAWHKATQEIKELTVGELARRIGLDHSTISNGIAVLGLPKPVLDVLDAGEMAIHAAREFLQLQVGKNVRVDVMKAVISRIRGDAAANHVGTDFKTPNVRRVIRDVIVSGGVSYGMGMGGERTPVGEWRPIEDSKEDSAGAGTGDYGKNARSGIGFDTQAFVASFPDHIFRIPTYSKAAFTGTRLWTDDAKEWQKWQSAATRAKNKAAGGTGPDGPAAGTRKGPTGGGSATARKTAVYETAFNKHPLVAAARPKTGTPAQKTAAVIGALEARTAQLITSVGGKKATADDNKKADAHVALHNGVRAYLQEAPTKKRLDGLIHDLTEGSLPAEIQGGEVLTEKEVIRSAANYAKDVAGQVSDALVAAAPGAPDLTKEQRDALGPLGLPLLEYQEYSDGFHASIKAAPPWMEDVKECSTRCTIGARFGHMKYHGDQDVELICTNKDHWDKKVNAGKAAYAKELEKERPRDEQLRHALEQGVRPDVPTGRMAKVVLYLLVGDRGKYLYYRLPRGDRANDSFAYVGANEQRICELLGVKPEELRGGNGYFTPTVTTIQRDAIGKVKDADAQELLARCLVSFAEEDWNLTDVFKDLGIAVPPKRATMKGA